MTGSIQRALICGALLGLLGQVSVPAGFMVAATDGGWPIVPCPGKLGRPTTHPDHEDESSERHHECADNDCGTVCFLGFVFAFSVELGEDVLAPPPRLEGEYRSQSSTPPTPGDSVLASNSRGPPSVSL